MRIALISDIHGNSLALQAVLDDLAAQTPVDAYYFLGDYVAIGPDPAGVMKLLDDVPNAHFIRGNTDRYVCTNELPPPSFEEAQQDSEKMDVYLSMVRGFAWTAGAMNAIDRYDWLVNLPFDLRLILPDGTRLLCIHSSPIADDGIGMRPGLDEATWAKLLQDCDADLVIGGHTHWPHEQVVNGIHCFNLGSVSNQQAPDLRAKYAILSADTNGYNLERRYADYDNEAVIAMCEKVQHPGRGFIAKHMRGELQQPWAKASLEG